MRNLIAFTGKIGSGKDTAAERFAELTTLPTVRVSFARKLKASAAAIFDIDPREWEDWKNDPNILIAIEHKKNPSRHIAEVTARQFLQKYGTEAHRDIFGYDFWVDQAFVEFDAYIGTQCVFLVTDCRFPNEAEAVKNRGGTIIQIYGPGEEDGVLGHASEHGLSLDMLDGQIINDKRDDNFADLDAQLRDLAESLGIPVTTWV